MAVHDPGGRWLRVRECPFCHPHGNKMDNMFKLHVNKAKGNYHCFRCGATGSFVHLKHRLKVLRQYGHDVGNEKDPTDAPGIPNSTDQDRPSCGQLAPRPAKDETDRWAERLEQSSWAQEYLWKARGLTMETARLYGVGLTQYRFKDSGGAVYSNGRTAEYECLSFPMHELRCDTAELTRVKFRAIKSKKHALHPVGGCWGLFGLHTVAKSTTELVLTEGEFDAMAVRQATGTHTL